MPVVIIIVKHYNYYRLSAFLLILLSSNFSRPFHRNYHFYCLSLPNSQLPIFLYISSTIIKLDYTIIFICFLQFKRSYIRFTISYLITLLYRSPTINTLKIIIFHVLLSSHLLTSPNSLKSLSPVYVLDLLLSLGNRFYLCLIILLHLDVKLKDPHLYFTR